MSKILPTRILHLLPLSLLLLLATTPPTLGRAVSPTTSPELKEALATALPGDIITLLPINYEGSFTLSYSPSSPIPITLQGTQATDNSGAHSTIISTTDGVPAISISGDTPILLLSLVVTSSPTSSGVVVDGNGHSLKSFVINGAGVGVTLHGDNNVLNSSTISNGGRIGVVVNGSGNSVNGVSINGLTQKGIVVESGSNGTLLRGISVNMFNNGARPGVSLDLKEGSSGTALHSTTLNGVALLGGNDGIFANLVVNGANLSGCGNTFRNAIINSMYQKTSGACSNNFEQSSLIGMWEAEPIE